jgi:alkylhydroperoxidase family enzyme
MARVPYLSREATTPETTPLWDRLEAERKRPTASLFRALAHAPAQLDGFLTYANALRDQSRLDPRLRELAILSVGYATDSKYEIAHHQSHGLRAGLTKAQLAAVPDFGATDLFDDLQKAVIRLARESTLRVHVSDVAWKEVAAHLDDQQMVELTMTIAWYNSGVRLMGLLEIELEENYLDQLPS